VDVPRRIPASPSHRMRRRRRAARVPGADHGALPHRPSPSPPSRQRHGRERAHAWRAAGSACPPATRAPCGRGRARCPCGTGPGRMPGRPPGPGRANGLRTGCQRLFPNRRPARVPGLHPTTASPRNAAQACLRAGHHRARPADRLTDRTGVQEQTPKILPESACDSERTGVKRSVITRMGGNRAGPLARTGRRATTTRRASARQPAGLRTRGALPHVCTGIGTSDVSGARGEIRGRALAGRALFAGPAGGRP
jgi:hypothetical protein